MVFSGVGLFELVSVPLFFAVRRGGQGVYVCMDVCVGRGGCSHSLRWTNQPPDRWQHYFSDHIPIHPWKQGQVNGSVLLLGQIPVDTAVLGTKFKFGTMDSAYK